MMAKSDKTSGSMALYLLVIICIALSPFATGWWSSAGASTGPFAYIPNSQSDNVSVIDTSSNNVVATIAVGSYPSGVAVNAAGTRVYVTNSFSDNVTVIDTSSNTVVATIAVGEWPRGIVVNPAGTRVYVVNDESNNVSVIDTSSNTVVATKSVGNGPEGIAINSAGTRVYVTNYGSDNVYIIDTATNTLSNTIAVGDGPWGIVVNPSGTRVYVANDGSDTISVIDTSTNTVVATVGVGDGPEGVAINPAGTRVYVTNINSDNVSVINTATNSVVATVTVGDLPQGIAVNPDGTRVYAVNTGTDNVSVIDTSINWVTNAIPVGNAPQAFGQFIGPILSAGSTLIAPTLSSPADGATGQDSNVSVTWTDTNSSPQETGYKVRIKPSGGSYTEYSTAQNATSFAVSGLSAGFTYYWSVKAVGDGTSTMDSTYPTDRSFTVSQSSAATYDATGTWNYVTSNHSNNCGDPNTNETGTYIINQTGGSFNASDGVFITYNGTVSGATYTCTFSYPEDGGTTTETITITLNSSTSGTGVSNWVWTDGSFTCSGSNDITIAKADAAIKGDLDGINGVTLADAILALKVVSGLSPGIRENYSSSGADVNGDGKVGMAEVLYILQQLSGVRN